MFDFIRIHQLNIMLFLCATSTIMALMLVITKFLPKRRKNILIAMETIATLLLGFDRLAYIYYGNVSTLGYVMVRLSNFMVFFMTSGIVFCFNLYLADLIESRTLESWASKRLRFVGIASIIGMLLAVVTVFTGLYYTFDSQNRYHRSAGFLIAYIIPVLCPMLQFSVIYKYRKSFSRAIYIGLILYIFVPIAVGIIQIFNYGLSIVNMSMVLVSVSLYVFTYIDINDEVQEAHNMEMEVLNEEKKRMKNIFVQTATSLVEALELRNGLLKDYSQKTADIALKIAKECGKSEEECDNVYYTALLHNTGVEMLSDELIGKEENLTADEESMIKNLPQVSAGILSKITAIPYLSKNVRYITERFDGKGWPERLKGEAIPTAARIVAVAKEYVSLSRKNKNRNPIPDAIIREEFVKEAGLRFDPVFANAMVHLIDAESNKNTQASTEPLETEISCKNYREKVSVGIPIQSRFTEVSFRFTKTAQEKDFSLPAIILFDSFDKKVHDTQKSIDAYHYVEYGEIFFDGHTISTGVRNMEVRESEKTDSDSDDSIYKITAARYEDHVLIKTCSPSKTCEVIAALPDISKGAYISLTGENCILDQIKMTVGENQVDKNSIPRIAEKISYINHLESDIPNVQINNPREEYTKGIAVRDKMKITFHTMSLPAASLVWHCPYILLYYSQDQKPGGKDYREYAFIKLNGEDNGSNGFAENSFHMTKRSSFESWNKWKEKNKAGFDCRIDITRKGNRITLSTENLGISIENQTKILEAKDEVFLALTGDQCAITDIRIS